MIFSNIFKRTTNLLLTGSMSIVFAACYGAQMKLENPKTIKAKDKSEAPIPGLEVSILENENVIEKLFTDENGFVEFQFPQDADKNYSAKIEDIDGSENLGHFKTKEIDLNIKSYIEINLEKKN